VVALMVTCVATCEKWYTACEGVSAIALMVTCVATCEVPCVVTCEEWYKTCEVLVWLL
jgi:hypothetical protein